MTSVGLYDIRWTHGPDFSLNNASMGGALKGLFQMRDGNNGEYFNGTAIIRHALSRRDKSSLRGIAAGVLGDLL